MKREIKKQYIKNKNYEPIFVSEIQNIIDIPKMPYCEFIHIGSTSIINSFGEEVVDILVIVENLHEITSFDEKRLNNLNYHRVAHENKGVVTYWKISNFSTMEYDVKLFIVQKNSKMHNEFLTFHNLLMQNESFFEAYQNFKKENISTNFKQLRKEKNIFIKRKLNEANKC